MRFHVQLLIRKSPQITLQSFKKSLIASTQVLFTFWLVKTQPLLMISLSMQGQLDINTPKTCKMAEPIGRFQSSSPLELGGVNAMHQWVYISLSYATYYSFDCGHLHSDLCSPLLNAFQRQLWVTYLGSDLCRGCLTSIWRPRRLLYFMYETHSGFYLLENHEGLSGNSVVVLLSCNLSTMWRRNSEAWQY